MTTDYFWKVEWDLPDNIGYALFSTEHLACIALVFGLVFLCMSFFSRLDDRKQRLFLRALPIIMVIMELFKDLFLVSVHRFGIGYLPLHVCSIGIFVFLLREALPDNKLKEVLSEIAFVLIMPGSIVALFDPDWTYIYPIWNYMSIHSYLWHGALVLYPALIMLRGDIKPTVKHIYWNILFLCIVVPPIYLFDKLFNCNYFFVNWPIPNSPLSWCASFLGNPGYLFGYAVLVIIMMLIVYFCRWMVAKVGMKERKEDETTGTKSKEAK